MTVCPEQGASALALGCSFFSTGAFSQLELFLNWSFRCRLVAAEL